MNKLLFTLFSIGMVFSSEKTKNITTIIKTDGQTNHQTRVEANIDNNVLKLTIEKDGEISTYEVDLKDVIELDAIRDLVEDLDIDIHLDSIFENANNPRTFGGNTFLGVHCEDISDQLRDYFKVKSNSGVLISEVVEDSPAETSKLKAGDIIIAFNDKEIWDSFDLTRTVKEYKPKDKVVIKVVRKGRAKKINVILGERDELFGVGFNGVFNSNYFKKTGVKKFNNKLFEDDEDFIFDDAELKKNIKELREEIRTLREELEKLKGKYK